MSRFTKRYIISSLKDLELSPKIRYERYYINDNLRIQLKNNIYSKEVLENNKVVNKEYLNLEEFNILKNKAIKSIIRNSYLYLIDEKISIKEYLGIHKGFIRVEVKFNTKKEMKMYEKPNWMEAEITNTKLAVDSEMYKLDIEQFKLLVEKIKNENKKCS